MTRLASGSTKACKPAPKRILQCWWPWLRTPNAVAKLEVWKMQKREACWEKWHRETDLQQLVTNHWKDREHQVTAAATKTCAKQQAPLPLPPRMPPDQRTLMMRLPPSVPLTQLHHTCHPSMMTGEHPCLDSTPIRITSSGTGSRGALSSEPQHTTSTSSMSPSLTKAADNLAEGLYDPIWQL